MISHLASAILALTAQQIAPPRSVVYKTSIIDSTGVISSPTVRTLDKVEATIMTSAGGRDFKFKFTPEAHGETVQENYQISIVTKYWVKKNGKKHEATRENICNMATRMGPRAGYVFSLKGDNWGRSVSFEKGQKLVAKKGEVLVAIYQELVKH